MKNIKISEAQILFNDICGILQNNLPYYESDDKDDFHYLVKKQHLHTGNGKLGLSLILKLLTKEEKLVYIIYQYGLKI